MKNIESLPSKSKQIVYSYLTGYCEDGSRRYLLIDTTAKKISLDFKGLVKIDLTPLKQLNDIKFLDLSNNLLSSFELKTVQSGSLRKLDLAKNYLSSVNLAEIRESFPNLEEIDLSYNELQTLDLESLKGWESLKIIGLNGNKKLKLDLAPLINCPNLVEIIASEEQELEAQGQTAEKLRIKRETVLEGIHKDGSKFIEELFDPEENPKKHIQIFSSEPVMEIDFEKIASILSEIETISMTFLELEKIDLAPLAGCPNLRELRLGGNNFSTIDLHPIENCYQLEEVDLGNNENLEELDITPLLNLKKLKAFYVSDDVKLYAKQSALIGELPIELRDFYSETIQWYQ